MTRIELPCKVKARYYFSKTYITTKMPKPVIYGLIRGRIVLTPQVVVWNCLLSLHHLGRKPFVVSCGSSTRTGSVFRPFKCVFFFFFWRYHASAASKKGAETVKASSHRFHYIRFACDPDYTLLELITPHFPLLDKQQRMQLKNIFFFFFASLKVELWELTQRRVHRASGHV